MYRALYRKYRPQRFEDVVGQTAITTALQNQITGNKIGHAYLFTGTRGTGKTTCAKIFAKAVNCETPQGAEPCGTCVACKGLEDGSILDVIEIDAASNNGVDDIRDLRDETAYRPSRCRFKVYIIDEVHMLSTAAFNALLKIMEEPPAHVIFILATTEIHKVPATILSRCQRYDFMRIQPEDMAQRLLYIAGQEEINLADAAADLIARLADGALRDAVSLLDTCAGANSTVDEALVRRMAGVADKEYLFEISKAAIAGDITQVLSLLNNLREKAIDTKRLCEELIYHYRNFILALAGKNGNLLDNLPQNEKELYVKQAADISEKEAIAAVRRLVAALDKMGRIGDPRVELELALFDLAATQEENTPPAPAYSTAPAASVAKTAEAREETPIPPASPVVKKEDETSTRAPLKESQTAEPLPVSAPVPDDGSITVFEAWPQVVQNMAEVDRMLYSSMKKAQAYTDGRRVLIDGGEMFKTYIREYKEAAEKLKNVIQEVTGRRYGIGPYTVAQPISAPSGEEATAKDTLQNWQEQGIPIKYE